MHIYFKNLLGSWIFLLLVALVNGCVCGCRCVVYNDLYCMYLCLYCTLHYWARTMQKQAINSNDWATAWDYWLLHDYWRCAPLWTEPNSKCEIQTFYVFICHYSHQLTSNLFRTIKVIHCKNEKWQQASMIGEALLKSLLCNKWVWMIWSQIRIIVMAKIVCKYVHVTSSSIPKHYSYWYHATLQKQDF